MFRPKYIFDQIQLNSFYNDKYFRLKPKWNSQHILRSMTFFRGVYEKMWENMVQPDRLQLTVWSTRIACWTPKATNTHSEYVMLIAFPLQQWLQERPSMLRYTCIGCLVWFTSPTLFPALACISQRTQPASIIKINQNKISYMHVGFHVNTFSFFLEVRWFDPRWCHWNFPLT